MQKLFFKMNSLAENTLLPLHLWVLELLQLWNISDINSGLWAYEDHFFTSFVLRNWSFMTSKAQYCLLFSYSFSRELWWRSRLEAMTECGFKTETKLLTSMNIFRQLWVLEAFEICFINFFLHSGIYLKVPFSFCP